MGTANKRHAQRDFLRWLKSYGCMKCKQHKKLLTFHHRDPSTKEFELGSLRSLSWSKLINEIYKCDILCWSCHKKEHR